MLQFLLADYLPGYGLPSLRKTVTRSTTRWTLESQPNSYTLMALGDGFGNPYTLVDTCKSKTVAIRLNNNYVTALLEDRSERIVNMGGISYLDDVDNMNEYLIEEE